MKFEIKKPNIQLPNIKMPKILKTPVQRSLTEEEVLKRLDIPDWRHMTKDKIMSFTSSLPYMDPEVAKEALKKFPEYAGMCTDVLSNINKSMNDVLDHADKSTKQIIEVCSSQIEVLQSELKKEDLSVEDKLTINDNIVMLIEKMSELKNHDDEQARKLFDKVMSFGTGVLILAAAIIGVDINKR